MSVVVNEVRRATYLDSVALMRLAQTVKALPGVTECGLMMGTPANLAILADAGVLAAEGEAAGPGDLVIAIAARDAATADAALREARRLLDQPRTSPAGGSTWAPRTLRSALANQPDSNLALISVPGAFAAAEAMKAISRGLNVMLFSDNVPVADEVRLKRAARDKGVLMMGPDCGTAIIGGIPLAFANVVERGDIGLIGASGTGIQEVSSLISNAGGGISQAIGTGGRDLKAEIGGITTLMAIDLLDHDSATRHIVLISKPPDVAVIRAVLARVALSAKTFTICFIGADKLALPANAKQAATLEDAALLALGRTITDTQAPSTDRRPGLIRGLFAGGTLCSEAQVVLRAADFPAASNVPIPGVADLAASAGRHTLIDLGDDAYTIGRPHPMIEPMVRDPHIRAALADPACAVVLLDCVLGHGAAADPAGAIVRCLPSRGAAAQPAIVVSVTGTDRDPQNRTAQIAKLAAAGAVIAASNAEATRIAIAMTRNRA
jgi:FdrA protein